jgi:hypothetical protein
MRGLAAVILLMATMTAMAASAPEPAATASAGEETRLAAEAKALAAAAAKRYGAGYTTQIDGRRHIVYVSALDGYTRDRVMGLLSVYADQEKQFLFPQPLPWNVTVILPTVSDYHKPQAAVSSAGHYDVATRTLESLSASDVIIHEFTHALHHADQVRANQRHPVWIREGLASLFQRSAMREGKLEMLVGRDLAGLQEAVRNHKNPAWAALLAMDQETFLKDADVCYGQSHYIFFYLNQLGKVKDFYEKYKAGYAADPTGGAALAKTVGKPLGEIESDWLAWVLKQESPWTPAQPAKPLLGIKMGAAAEGVEVEGFVRGGAAERAGQLKVRDIILSVAGQETPTARDLTAAVQGCRVGETIDIEVIRDGRTLTVKQLLGATPP